MQSARQFKRLSIFAACLAAVLFLGSVPSIGAKAATYRGSGTKTDPYLVETAEQLQGIRDNLSAHYKLANTIDLSGVDFKPIGRLDGPFVGSFTCELNSDNTPKYVIKNLSVKVTGTYNHLTYVDKKGKMEAALFGAAKGATISGIYVMDANISNSYVGDNDGVWIDGVKTSYPGMDDMFSAVLVGYAESAMISNCGTTGVVNSSSNHCGGVIGRAIESTIKNCYSTVTVTTNGKWHAGGLIGSMKGGIVSSSFATGNVTGSQSCISSLVGSVNGSTIMDCYSTGKASGGKETKNAFVAVPTGYSATMKNCFALGSVDVEVGSPESKITANNCWALSGKLHNIPLFTEGSLTQISAAFKGLAGWSADGSSQPKLTGIGVVTDASVYVPTAVSEPTSTTPGTSIDGTQAEINSTTDIQLATVTAEQVTALIEALPDPAEKNAITLEHLDAIREAYEAYESLSAGEKDKVAVELVSKIESARYKISVLLAAELVDDVVALPEVEDLTPEYVDEIMALWKNYEFIDESVLAELDKDIVDKLKAAYEYASQIKENGATYVNITDVFTGWQKIILIVSIALFVAALVFNVVMIIIYMKRTQSPETKAIKSAKRVAKTIAKKAKKEK